MKHKKCGGKFVKVTTKEYQRVYKCNRCNETLTFYSGKKDRLKIKQTH